ncbi:ATP-binding protein [Nostoc sp. CHAB 5784]|uniref:ATP-binding protein n=1 Tax=Nostoc mirabile TaxID=2907820 RepID=UPI001E4534FD|nr:ATP-binding protein [Nostoc mirabile]MCC5662752.1 ATP-binding protein [Nostoc mirabile CHAB5784]
MPRVHPLRAFQNNGDVSSVAQQGSFSQNSTSTSSVGVASEPNKSLDSTIDFSPYLKEPEYSLEDVALPRETKRQLESVFAELEHQDLIYREWGMGKKHKLGKALSINFFGPPGTGKTLSAEATAHAFNLKILAVPYQLLESKYVGETPKNIAKAFEFATEHKAVLFFDEADSFLGKRLENVTQSSDTAVNLTRSVMLMQLSAYEGVVIFATNLIRNFDPAFISRIRWQIQFDLPDQETRAKIWKIQFPSQLPLDTSVNCNELAQRFEDVSGRDIQNAVFQAVVAAAKEDKPKEHKQVTQSHLMDAMNQIIEANKAASKPEFVLKPVEGEVQLPPVSNA